MDNKKVFGEFDIELVSELTTLLNQATEEDEPIEWFAGDIALEICLMATIALEFDRLTPMNSHVRKQIRENMRENTMLIDSELGSPYNKDQQEDC